MIKIYNLICKNIYVMLQLYFINKCIYKLQGKFLNIRMINLSFEIKLLNQKKKKIN